MIAKSAPSSCGWRARLACPHPVAAAAAAAAARPTWAAAHRAARRGACRAAGSSGSGTSSSDSGEWSEPPRWRVRRAKRADAEAVAEICAQSFASTALPGLPDTPFLREVEGRYAVSIRREVVQKLLAALDSKAKAALECRTYRRERDTAMLRAQIAALQGLPAVFPTDSPQSLRAQQRWRRCRQFTCLLAEDADTGRAAGCCFVSVSQPEAALPPPFPSAAPQRAYVANFAVVPPARRRGAARALLAAAVRTADLWGEASVWLHVGTANEAARALYASAGFAPVRGSVGTQLSNAIPGPWSQTLMARALAGGGGVARWAAALEAGMREEAAAAAALRGAGGRGSGGGSSSSRADGGIDSSSGSSQSSGGAYRWQALVAEEQQRGSDGPA
ncbi:hypothetical protein Rsub_08558 [Raphidocelis subcapitata]|uniref:N-acetyltransferase domain-containing protein n=1 Tax=Raphidocelis subcapitata TaxID=307507 RepID=A0A2V0PEH7_9CHLO|nr:hypothetical protein Rsub_08558 [Raphidocelis subcapitata]|eukprot:GBF95577.1 hypothetical protein Rsub_08558 [Raphidocelis subcapitata]